ncbi:hypothetical protein JRC04_04715 [Mycolicibacterium sp. S2-37]|uniref:hypothetical protein n=1 Tax=Mycolicibacterium sp. S2-37 TaxID=2810297 RepID=UPI001A951B6E|nr:hypothetical protein [Mycolicibacterium sp. S2-37]MBO0676761.1 hypothetical protein [Mycolicibacterium sp. S2-37]
MTIFCAAMACNGAIVPIDEPTHDRDKAERVVEFIRRSTPELELFVAVIEGEARKAA